MLSCLPYYPSSGFEELAASDLSVWHGVDFKPKALISISYGEVIYKTIPTEGRKSKVRVIYRKTAGGDIIQVGFSLGDDTALIKKYRNIFGTAIAVMMVFGSFIGWSSARRSISGVKRVTQTAARISMGNLNHRIPIKSGEGTEIADLIMTFNFMIEKIDSLVQELKEVTNNIAHDLRSPITRIRGTSEMAIIGKQSNEEYRKMAGMVVEESDHLIGMINTMLEIAETDSGVIEYSKSPVNMVEVANNAFELFHPVAEDKGVSLEIIYPRAQIFTMGDIMRLQG